MNAFNAAELYTSKWLNGKFMSSLPQFFKRFRKFVC